MAERKPNLGRLRQSVMYGAPTRPWSNINFSGMVPNMPHIEFHKAGEALKNLVNVAHPFATKIGEGVVNAAKSSITNLNPIGRERLWYAGAAVGAAESLILIPLGVSWTKGIINAGAMQGFLLAANKGWVQNNDVKTFFKGVSAGGVYGSFGLSLASQFINFQDLFAPHESAPSAATATATPVSTVEAKLPTATTPAATDTAVSSHTAVPTVEATHAATAESTHVATVEPTHTPVPTATPNDHLGGSPTPDSSSRIGFPREPDIPSHQPGTPIPDQNPDHPFSGFTPELPADLGAPITLPTPDLSFSAKIAKFMADNKDNQDIFTQHTVASGETAGHMLVQMDAPVSWDGMDWQGFAILHELNPDAFTDLQTHSGLSDEQFDELITKIKAGDRAAYRELINKMGGVKAGAKLTMLSKKGMSQLLAIVGSNK